MTDPTLTITFNQQEVSLILGAIADVLNIIGEDHRINEDQKKMMALLEALQTRFMTAPWTA